jgi:hypothetical protein
MLLFIPYFKTASAEEFLPSLAAVVPDGTRLQSFNTFCGSEYLCSLLNIRLYAFCPFECYFTLLNAGTL